MDLKAMEIVFSDTTWGSVVFKSYEKSRKNQMYEKEKINAYVCDYEWLEIKAMTQSYESVRS